jgi:hypothetical protein
MTGPLPAGLEDDPELAEAYAKEMMQMVGGKDLAVDLDAKLLYEGLEDPQVMQNQ